MPTTLLNPPLPGNTGSVGWSNLHGAAFGLAVAEACIAHEGLLLVVMDDPRQLHLLEREVRFFLGTGDPEVPVVHFPSWECLPYDVFSPHQDIISERLRLLARLSAMRRGVLLTSSENLMQRLPPVDYVLGHSFSVNVGDRLDLDALRDRLANAHYFSVSQVVSPGEFAVRGGIV
ncbi:MAG: transcription-repair coupling factor, partial [Gammaproteobacteria bacterium]|nr:transcription-repair coupling factor [Gammaproteobacteria bacterium]